jgi:hypothetical protein
MENKILEYLETLLISKQNLLESVKNLEKRMGVEIDLLEEIIFEIKNNI